jgi:SAM-dependent methyltransferase
MAEFHRFYGRALVYDIGMGRAVGRDFGREVAFLTALFERGARHPARSLLELACGPGYHACEAARRGLLATGLDLSPDMLAYARELAAGEGLAVNWIEGDLRRFAIPAPVDIVVAPFDAIDVLLTNADVVAHFRAVAAALAPDGIYLVDLSHPRDCSPWHYGSHRYEGEQDGMRVVIEAGVNGPPIDAAAQVAETEMRITVERDGRTEVIRDLARERFFHPQEIVALADLSGVLEVSEFFGDYDLEVPFDLSARATRLIAVMTPVPHQGQLWSGPLE